MFKITEKQAINYTIKHSVLILSNFALLGFLLYCILYNTINDTILYILKYTLIYTLFASFLTSISKLLAIIFVKIQIRQIYEGINIGIPQSTTDTIIKSTLHPIIDRFNKIVGEYLYISINFKITEYFKYIIRGIAIILYIYLQIPSIITILLAISMYLEVYVNEIFSKYVIEINKNELFKLS